MNPFRRVALVLISPLLPLLLFMTALSFGVIQTIGSPNDIKKLVNDSGLYNSVVPSLLNQTKSVQTSIGNIPTDDPVIKQAANQALPPKDVQKNAEAAIDSIYAWLNGKTAQPTFRLDLTSSQAAFADNLASALQTKAAGLPACTTPFTSTSFDIENATCLPPGVSPAALAAQVKSQVNSGQSFITKPVLTANDLKSDGGKQSIFQNQWKDLPAKYKQIKGTPYVLILLTLLVALGIIFLSPSWQRGLRHVGWTLAIMGLFTLFVAWALSRSDSSLFQTQVNINNAVLQTDIRKLLTDIVSGIDHYYWLFGGIYTALGILALALPPYLMRRRPVAETIAANTTPAAPASQKSPKQPPANGS